MLGLGGLYKCVFVCNAWTQHLIDPGPRGPRASRIVLLRIIELSPPPRWLATTEPTPPPRCLAVFSAVFLGTVSLKLPLSILQSSVQR